MRSLDIPWDIHAANFIEHLPTALQEEVYPAPAERHSYCQAGKGVLHLSWVTEWTSASGPMSLTFNYPSD